MAAATFVELIHMKAIQEAHRHGVQLWIIRCTTPTSSPLSQKRIPITQGYFWSQRTILPRPQSCCGTIMTKNATSIHTPKLSLFLNHDNLEHIHDTFTLQALNQGTQRTEHSCLSHTSTSTELHTPLTQYLSGVVFSLSLKFVHFERAKCIVKTSVKQRIMNVGPCLFGNGWMKLSLSTGNSSAIEKSWLRPCFYLPRGVVLKHRTETTQR